MIISTQLLPWYQWSTVNRTTYPSTFVAITKGQAHRIPKYQQQLNERGFNLVKVNEHAGFYGRAKHTNFDSNFLPPTPNESRNFVESLRWLDVVISPVMLSTLKTGKIVRGLDGIPSEGPVLFVGYHNMLALETFPMIRRFITEKNLIIRTLTHPTVLKRSKGVKMHHLTAYDIGGATGAVRVSAFNLYNLLSMKSHILLYPGGAREVLHRKGEEYKLFWPEQAEFVRMAATFGAKIIPFGAVGEDDFSQLVLDYNEQMKISFLSAYIEALTNESVKLRTDAKGEVANQDMHVPVLLPKVPGRYYYLFGKPIETKGMKQELSNKEKAEELYLQVKSEVEKCLAYCKKQREEDPYRNIIRRFMYQATHGGFDSEVPTFHIY